MSTTIDSRVVEMSFDNSKFEKNVKQSTQSLNDLNESVKNLEKSGDTSNIEESLDKIAKRCSALGVAGATVIANLTTSAMSAISKITSSINSMVIDGGLSRSLNIEKAKFQLEGLGIEWESVFNDINYAVSGTAYSLDAAALAASNLAASGVSYQDVAQQLTDINQITEYGSENLSSMAQALGAISGVAAMTSSDFASIASIFSTVAGQGKLMTMQLRQLENRGMNAAAKIGEYLGKTEQEVRDMVTRGEIDFSTFASAMYNQFYSHAKDANNTVTGVLANIKSAFAKIGADFFTPILENEGPLNKMLEAFRLKVVDLRKAITPIVKVLSEMAVTAINGVTAALESMNLDGFTDKIKRLFGVFDEESQIVKLQHQLGKSWGIFEEQLIAAARAAGTLPAELASGEETFIESLKHGWLTFDVFATAVENLTTALTGSEEAASEVVETVTELGEVVRQVINGDFGNGSARVQALTEAGYDFATVQNLVNEELGSSVRHLSDLTEEEQNYSDAQLEASGYTSDQIELLRHIQHQAGTSGTALHEMMEEINNSPRWLLIDTVQNAMDAIRNFTSAVREAWNEVFPGTNQDLLTNLIRIINIASKAILKLTENTEGIKNTFKGIFSIFSLFGYIIKSIVNAIYTLVSGVSGVSVNIYDLTGAIGKIITIIVDWIKDTDILGKVLNGMATVISTIVNVVKKLFEAIKNSKAFTNIINGISEALKKIGEIVKDDFKGVNTIIENFVTRLNSIDKISLKDIIDAISDLGNSIKEHLFGSESGLAKFGEKIKTVFETIKGSVTSIDLSGLGKLFKQFGEKLKEALGKINIGSIIATVLSTAFSIALVKVASGVMTSVTALRTALAGLITAMGGFITSLKFSIDRYIKVKEIEALSVLMKNFGLAILMLVASIAILAFIPKEKLIQGCAALGGLLIAITAFIFLCSKFMSGIKDTANLATIGLSVLAMAVSIGIIVLAIGKLQKVLSGMNDSETERLISVFVRIVSCLITMLTFLVIAELTLSKSIGKIEGKTNNIAVQVLEMCVGILLIAQALKILSKIEFNDELMYKVGLLLSIIAAMGAVLIVGGKVSSKTGQAGLAILAMTASLLLVIKAIKKIAKMPTQDIAKGISVIYMLGGFYAGLIAACRLLTTGGGSTSILQASVLILAITASLLIMINAIKMIAKMDANDLKKGLVVIGILEGFIVGLLLIFNLLDKLSANLVKASLTIMGVGVAIILIAVAMKILSTIDVDKLIPVTAAMAVIIGQLAGVIFAMKYLVDGSAYKSILMVGITLAIISASLAILSFIPVDRLIPAVAALGIIMLELAAVFTTVALVGNAVSNPDLIGQMIVLAAMLALITAALVVLSNVKDTDALIKSAESLSIVLTSVCGALVLMSKNTKEVKLDNLMKQLVAVAAVLAVSTGVLAVLSHIGNPEVLIPAAVALSILMLTVAGALTAMGFATDVASTSSPEGIAKTLVMMVAILAATTGVLVILSSLKNADKVVPIAEALGNLLLKLAVVMLVMAIAADLTFNLYGFLMQMGMLLIILASVTAVISILVGLKNIDKMGYVCNILSEFLLKLSGIMIIMGIACDITFNPFGFVSLVTSMVAALASITAVLIILSEYGDISKFSTITDEVCEFLERLSYVMVVLEVAGLAGFAVENGVAAMVMLIVSMGIILTAFGNIASLVNGYDKVIQNGIKILVLIGEGIGRFIGALVDGFMTESTENLDVIGERLSSFLEKLTPFIEEVKTMDDTAVKGVKYLAAFVAAIGAASFLMQLGNIASKLSGVDPDNVSTLGGIVDNLATIIESCNELDYYGIKGINALGDIVKAIAAISFSDFLTSINPFASNSTTLESFGSSMSNLGDGVKSFAESISGVSDENLSKFSTAADALAILMQMSSEIAPNTESFVSLMVGTKDLGKFGDQLGTLGTNMASFVENISGLDEEDVTKAGYVADMVKVLAEAANEIPQNSDKWNFNELWNGVKDLGKFSEDLITVAPAISSAVDNLIATGFISDDGQLTSKADGVEGLCGFITKLGTALRSLPSSKNTSYDGFFFDFAVEINPLIESIQMLPQLGKALHDFIVSCEDLDFSNAEGIFGKDGNLDNSPAGLAVEIMSRVASGLAGLKDVKPKLIKNLGEAMPYFAESVEGFISAAEEVTDIERLSSFINGPLSQLILQIGSIGGLDSTDLDNLKVLGNNSSGGKGLLAKLGEGMKGFYNATNDIDISRTGSLCTSLKTFLSSIGFILNRYPDVFDISIGQFGTVGDRLGKGLKNYLNQIKDFSDSDFSKVEDSKDALYALLNNLGLHDITDFSVKDSFPSTVKKIGESLGEFLSGLGNNMSTSALDLITKAGYALSSLSYGLSQIPSDITDGSVFKTACINITDALVYLSENYEDINPDNIKSEQELIESINSMLESVASADVNESPFVEAMKSFGTDGVMSFCDAIESDDSISSGENSITSLLNELASKIESMKSTYYDKFKAAGVYVGKGFADGIQSEVLDVISACNTLGDTAINQLKNVLGIASPSKVARQMGVYFGEGFMLGEKDSIRGISLISDELASTAVDGLALAISAIGDMVDSDMDVTPTITPVMDLSNVRNGVGAINGMFGSAQLAYSTGSISTGMTTIQNARTTNADVVKAISDLRDNVGNTSNNYTVNGITYDDGSNVSNAVKSLVHAAKIERRM